jgi:hypothetical protein
MAGDYLNIIEKTCTCDQLTKCDLSVAQVIYILPRQPKVCKKNVFVGKTRFFQTNTFFDKFSPESTFG